MRRVKESPLSYGPIMRCVSGPRGPDGGDRAGDQGNAFLPLPSEPDGSATDRWLAKKEKVSEQLGPRRGT